MRSMLGVTMLAGAVLAATLGGAVPGATAADPPKPWRHGLLEAKSDAGIILMPSRGGFAVKQGLALEIVQIKSDITGLQALLAGELDSFEGGIGGSIKVAARGVDVKFVGCFWQGLPHGIFVKAGIASVEQLRGKAFAISAPGAMPDSLARALLDKHSIPSADVRFVNLGSDLDRFKALAAGVVDAAVVSGEYLPIAQDQGLKLLVPGREVLPNYIRNCTMMTGKTLAGRPEDAVRFLAAEISGLRYALSHREEALKLAREITEAKPGDPRAAYIFDDAVSSGAVDPDMPIPIEKIAWMQDLLVRSGDMTQPGDVAKMIDPRPREKALALLGP
ncbi:MAG: ABC transporter substrate-binding protein [Proteobacteria bacterium]|nr:ABC transporter substrate-binding protein [Pseudomonadota bacterium]MBI3499454.1 ABC transporter substrate-binding protein [Pseudomonadota bacterium]